jgi:hypothetical protein
MMVPEHLLRRAGTNRLRLSPGDLDEAVATLFVFGRAGTESQGTAFERIAGFRTGVLEGLAPPCE